MERNRLHADAEPLLRVVDPDRRTSFSGTATIRSKAFFGLLRNTDAAVNIAGPNIPRVPVALLAVTGTGTCGTSLTLVSTMDSTVANGQM